jgi:hypothetical protein
MVSQDRAVLQPHKRQAEVRGPQEPVAEAADRGRMRRLLGPVDLIEDVRVRHRLCTGAFHGLLHDHLDGAGHQLDSATTGQLACPLAQRALVVRAFPARPEGFGPRVAGTAHPAAGLHHAPGQRLQVDFNRHLGALRLGMSGRFGGHLGKRLGEQSRPEQRPYGSARPWSRRRRRVEKGGAGIGAGLSARGRPGPRCSTLD